MVVVDVVAEDVEVVVDPVTVEIETVDAVVVDDVVVLIVCPDGESAVITLFRVGPFSTMRVPAPVCSTASLPPAAR